uniref:Uncharacterized protein n=1 Tax=Anguilla anguilla TaxID=7936 RepID=A0A0E9SY13_ANGAN
MRPSLVYRLVWYFKNYTCPQTSLKPGHYLVSKLAVTLMTPPLQIKGRNIEQ